MFDAWHIEGYEERQRTVARWSKRGEKAHLGSKKIVGGGKENYEGCSCTMIVEL